MENNRNSEYKIANADADALLFKNRKRPRLSPQLSKTQNENKYLMEDGRDVLSATDTTHKYTTTCESFIEDQENGFITNSVTDVLSDSSVRYDHHDQCSSSKSVTTNDDLKHENIELYTNFEPQEGRPILNTSMIRFANQNHSKGRSPLTAVDNQNAVQSTLTQKKYVPTISSDEAFNYYQRKLPQNMIGIDHFATLSYEMILSVFQWLPKKTLMRCSLVCKRFNVAAQDESLWGRLDLSGKNLNAGALGRILRRGPVVLRLAQTKIPSPIFLEDEANTLTCAKLQYMDLSMAVISPQSLTELLGTCKNLKKLSLETVPLDTDVCNAISQNRHLEALNLTMCTGLNENGITKLFTNLKSLQNLNISWTALTVECIDAFIKSVPKMLIRLNISGCRKSITDQHVEKLVVRCPGLLELDISDCVNLTEDTIRHVTKLKHLEYLSMSRCYNVTASSYVTLIESLSLAYLDIFGIMSNDAIKMMQRKFPAIGINKYMHSAVARPTVGTRRTSIWGLRTRDG